MDLISVQSSVLLPNPGRYSLLVHVTAGPEASKNERVHQHVCVIVAVGADKEKREKTDIPLDLRNIE